MEFTQRVSAHVVLLLGCKNDVSRPRLWPAHHTGEHQKADLSSTAAVKASHCVDVRWSNSADPHGRGMINEAVLGPRG
jgi:hypothetical protein